MSPSAWSDIHPLLQECSFTTKAEAEDTAIWIARLCQSHGLITKDQIDTHPWDHFWDLSGFESNENGWFTINLPVNEEATVCIVWNKRLYPRYVDDVMVTKDQSRTLVASCAQIYCRSVCLLIASFQLIVMIDFTWINDVSSPWQGFIPDVTTLVDELDIWSIS